jgi:hypothetical protein
MAQGLRDSVWDFIEKRFLESSQTQDRRTENLPEELRIPGSSTGSNNRALLILEHDHTLRGWEINPEQPDADTGTHLDVTLWQDGKWVYVGGFRNFAPKIQLLMTSKEHSTTVRGIIQRDRLLEWNAEDDRNLLYSCMDRESSRIPTRQGTVDQATRRWVEGALRDTAVLLGVLVVGGASLYRLG